MQNKHYFIITLLLIIIFGGLASWNFSNLGKKPISIDLPNIDTSDLNVSSGQGEIKEKEFVSKDNEFKIKYNSGWQEIEAIGANNQDLTKENAEILLFAQKFNLNDSFFAFLTVQRMNFEEEKNIDEVIEYLKSSNPQTEMEITEIEKNDKGALMSFDYLKDRQVYLNAKNRIIIDENKAYLIDIAAQKENLKTIEEEVNNILNSAEVLNENSSPLDK